MNHLMNIYVARDYGINEALLLNNIYFWVQHNKANNTNFHDGFHWVYNSAEAFKKLFIYLTKRQIEYALIKLEENGLIKFGNFNKHKYDRTRWYTTTEKAEIYFKPANELMLQNCNMNVTPLSHNVTPLSQANYNNVTPIPDINTDINSIYKPDIISSKKILKNLSSKNGKKSEDEKHARKERDRELKRIFTEEIWERYPKSHRVGEKTCFSKFKSAIKNGSSQEEILEGFNRYFKVIEINQRKGTEQFIKRLDNWFASESWKNPNMLMVSQYDSKMQHQMNSKYPTQNYCGLPPVFRQEKEEECINIEVSEEEYNQWMGI